jgi:hypothetical protein
MNTFDLKARKPTVTDIHRNLPPISLYDHANGTNGI